MPEITEYPAKLTTGSYRVRTSWEDADSQIGAYRVLASAIKKCDANPGTSVFADDGTKIYPEEEEITPEQEEGATAEESVVAFGKLKALMNIRSAPSPDGEIIKTLEKGTLVSILEVLDSGWLKIICEEAENGTAYVSNESDTYVNIGTDLYTVRSGDTLWKIAADKLGGGIKYKEIRKLNALNSNVIKVGMQLLLP